jgi:hypothetical protein
MTTTASTFSVVERDALGHEINRIAGLLEPKANELALILQMGTAYEGDNPRVCHVVRELTDEERRHAAATRWLREKDNDPREPRCTARQLADSLQLAAAHLVAAGERQMDDVWLKLEFHVRAGATNSERRSTVERLAEALKLTPVDEVDGYRARSSNIRIEALGAQLVAIESSPAIGIAAVPSPRCVRVEPEHRLASHTAGDGEFDSVCACGIGYSRFTDPDQLDELFAKHCANPGEGPWPIERCACGKAFEALEGEGPDEALEWLTAHITEANGGRS